MIFKRGLMVVAFLVGSYLILVDGTKIVRCSHEIDEWPLIQGTLVHREVRVAAARQGTSTSRRGGGMSSPLGFLEETYRIQWNGNEMKTVARDFVSSGPAFIYRTMRHRNLEIPVGTMVPLRVDPTKPIEATVFVDFPTLFATLRADLVGLAVCILWLLYCLLRAFFDESTYDINLDDPDRTPRQKS